MAVSSPPPSIAMTLSAADREFFVELGAGLAALLKARPRLTRANSIWQQQMLDGLLAGSAAA